mgnify:CR=1 FL=1
MEFADGKELAPNDLRPMHKLWLVAGSTLSLVGRYSNLMVFRTFSKAYGLAGLRCGYAVGALGLRGGWCVSWARLCCRIM